MIERIKDILNEMPGLAGWKIIRQWVESSELFFVGQRLDMNRGKKVEHYQVTVYKDFKADGKKYRGSSTTSIHPTMLSDEIKRAIGAASLAATYVKNEYYPLVKPSALDQPSLRSGFSTDSRSAWLPKLSEALYRADRYQQGRINSAELFLSQIKKRLVNSAGVDVAYEKYRGELEFITNWQEEGEEVELYKKLDFSDFQPALLTSETEKMLEMSREKARAVPTPILNNCPVILTGDSVEEFFNYYLVQSAAQYVYERISTAKIGENIQGSKVKGDLISLKLDPFIDGSTESAPYDQQGFPLRPTTVFEKGVLQRYWGNQRFCHYLGAETTGEINNVVIEGGTYPVATLKKEPYLELLAFSDFHMDPLIGDFAGEIRLGRYYDGEKTVAVTGGSISGNIKEVQECMYLSKEVKQNNNYIGPESLKLSNVSIAGN